MTESESQLQIRVANYLIENYPDIQFHSDYGAGVKLTKRQAAVQKAQNGGRKGWPDMFIAKPRILAVGPDESNVRTLNGEPVVYYHGLFVELKKEGVRIHKKNGEWADEHIAEQAEVHQQLQKAGYAATFAVGFDEAVKIITAYLGKPTPKEVEF